MSDLTTTNPAPISILNIIAQAATDPAVDVVKMTALLDMQERVMVKQAEAEFNASLMRIPPIYVKKNGVIDLTSKDDRAAGRANVRSVPFARWEDISKVIQPMLEAEGFRLLFNAEPRQGDGGGLIVTGTLLHRSGHSHSARMPLALDSGPGRNNLQAMGSTLSYGKRYCTEMLLNIVREDEDDDGRDGGKKYIELEQAERIEALITETKTDRTRFMQYFNIASITEMQAKQFEPAINMLHAKKGAKS
jgi:ERF superfamily